MSMLMDLSVTGPAEAYLIDTLPFLRGYDFDGAPVWFHPTVMLDIIGHLEDGSGFYINLRGPADILDQVPQMVRSTATNAIPRSWF